MRLGATLHRYCGLKISDPDGYIAECRRQGFRAAQAPDHRLGSSEDLRRICAAFAEADITIAEVGGWSNPLDPRPGERTAAIAATGEALAVADELGALCCINVAGSLCADKSYGPHPDNFSDDAFDAVVQWVQQVLREVKPRRSKLTIESAPWTPVDGLTAYVKLVDAVDHPAFAVHFDPVNFVLDARTYYSTGAMIDETFDRLGHLIVGCHAKDVRQGDPKTVQLSEVPPGEGVLDYRRLLAQIARRAPEMPLIVEHLTTEHEYAHAAQYIREVAAEIGAPVYG